MTKIHKANNDKMEGQKQMSWWKVVNENWVSQSTYSIEEFSGEKGLMFLYSNMTLHLKTSDNDKNAYYACT